MKVNKLKITISTLILLVIVSFVFVFFIKKPSLTEREGETIIKPYTYKEIRPEIITKIEKPAERLKVYPSKIPCEPSTMPPSGKIYLSLSKRGDNIGVYVLDLTTRKIEDFLVGSNNIWFLRFSTDGKKIVYLSDKEGETQIYVADENKQNTRQITFSKEMKYNPIFSPNGRVFFTKVPEISGILADEWEIYYINENGKEEFFDYGSSIVFSPDGNFALTLKATGVFSVNLKNGEVEKAIELRNESDNLILGKIINGKLSLSRDGRYLSFSNAQDRGEFYVFEIYSWNPFEYRLKAILNEIGFWSTFSPDGKYIAIQTAEKFDEGLPINPKLVIYDTCTFNKVLEYDLSEYASESMWVTDWR